MKNNPILIICLVFLFSGGLIACTMPSLDSASNDTPAEQSAIEEVNIESAESVVGSRAVVTVEPTTTFIITDSPIITDSSIITDTPSPVVEPLAEWLTFEDPSALFTLRYPAYADFSPQLLDNELFDYGYTFYTSEGNQSGIAITFKVMPPPASDDAWLALANSPDLLTMLDQQFQLRGFVEQQRDVHEGDERIVFLEGVFSEVQYSRMRFEERDGIWVLMGLFYPVDNPPAWERQIKETVDRFTWSPEHFGQALAGTEDTPAENTAQEIESYLFSDVMGVFHLSYPADFRRVSIHSEGYGYTFATSDQLTTLKVRFAPLAEPIAEQQWPTFVEHYFAELGADPKAGQLTFAQSGNGEQLAILDIEDQQSHQWLRLAESQGMLALMMSQSPPNEWSRFSQSNIFQSWNQFVWYPASAQAFFNAQASLVPYGDPAGIFGLQHPADFNYVYEGASEQIGADYSATLSNAADVDIEADVLELAITLQREGEEPNETVLMLADPEDSNWSWTGETDHSRGYSYIDFGDTIILSFNEVIEGDLFTATWIVSLETWQIEKAAIMASLQSISWSPEAVGSKQ